MLAFSRSWAVTVSQSNSLASARRYDPGGPALYLVRRSPGSNWVNSTKVEIVLRSPSSILLWIMRKRMKARRKRKQWDTSALFISELCAIKTLETPRWQKEIIAAYWPFSRTRKAKAYWIMLCKQSCCRSKRTGKSSTILWTILSIWSRFSSP